MTCFSNGKGNCLKANFKIRLIREEAISPLGNAAVLFLENTNTQNEIR
jgi:hypothetical protein